MAQEIGAPSKHEALSPVPPKKKKKKGKKRKQILKEYPKQANSKKKKKLYMRLPEALSNVDNNTYLLKCPPTMTTGSKRLS
jgi:hypothetical protein